MNPIDNRLVLGAVAYAPKVVTIWEGFRSWLYRKGLNVDYVLYSNYEAQTEALLAGSIDLAWQSPLAWVRTRRAALAAGLSPRVQLMRDTDRDLTSVVLVRSDFTGTIDDLTGAVIAVGAYDSPQSRLIPLAHLHRLGVDLTQSTVTSYDHEVGKHGDHIGGERAAARALIDGRADAACIIAGNQTAFSDDATIEAGSVTVVAETEPYDHCIFASIGDRGASERLERFDSLLLSMSFEDPEVRPLLELEGLHEWVAGRTTGFAQIEHAVDLFGFYDADGRPPDPAHVP